MKKVLVCIILSVYVNTVKGQSVLLEPNSQPISSAVKGNNVVKVEAKKVSDFILQDFRAGNTKLKLSGELGYFDISQMTEGYTNIIEFTNTNTINWQLGDYRYNNLSFPENAYNEFQIRNFKTPSTVPFRIDKVTDVITIQKLKLPIGAGLGKVLQSDADGNVSWQNATSGLWQQSGNFIQNTNSNGFWSSYSAVLPVNADNTTNPPISPTTGNGTRLEWIPSRSAFHGGTFNMNDGSVRFISENIGLFSFCYGLNAEARSRGGVAVGSGAIADGTSNTIAFGENVSVRGERNASLGFNNEIPDGNSNTILVGENSIVSSGQYNHGLGWGLSFSGFGTSAFGMFNTPLSGSSNAWIASDPLFIIGNGSSDAARSNAMVVQKNGIVNIGFSPTTTTTYRMRVNGSALIQNTLQATGLRATNLSGTGTRNVCADASGNLVVCNTAETVFNISAMGFQPQVSSGVASSAFQRNVLKCLVSFQNNTKSTEASMYAPVELPDGTNIMQMAFHYLQSAGSNMTVRFVSVAKTSNTNAITLISITSNNGSAGVIQEKNGNPDNPVLIDNRANYYYLILEAGANNWLGSEMALRGVLLKTFKD